MDEIMQSVCALAQDQYGNYVIQVLKFSSYASIIDWRMKSFVPRILVCPVILALDANPKILVFICQNPLNMKDNQGRSSLCTRSIWKLCHSFSFYLSKSIEYER